MKGLRFIGDFLVFVLALLLIPIAVILLSVYVFGALLIALIFKKRSNMFAQVIERLCETYESLLNSD